MLQDTITTLFTTLFTTLPITRCGVTNSTGSDVERGRSMDYHEWMGLYGEDDRFLLVPQCLLRSELPNAAAIVYAVIARDADEEGVLRISQKRIGQMTGYSRMQISRAINALIEADLIEPEPERTGRANIYRLTTRLIPYKPRHRKKPDEPAETSPENTYFQDLLREV